MRGAQHTHTDIERARFIQAIAFCLERDWAVAVLISSKHQGRVDSLGLDWVPCRRASSVGLKILGTVCVFCQIQTSAAVAVPDHARLSLCTRPISNMAVSYPDTIQRIHTHIQQGPLTR